MMPSNLEGCVKCNTTMDACLLLEYNSVVWFPYDLGTNRKCICTFLSY